MIPKYPASAPRTTPDATLEPPPLRITGNAPLLPNELGPPELQVPEGADGAARRQPFDWALVWISVAFLAGAGAIFTGGYYAHKGDTLATGETVVIADRPALAIPDSGSATPIPGATPGASPITPVASTSSQNSSSTPAGVPYNMNAPSAQGGAVGNRPNAKVVPGQQGPIDPNKLFMPPPGQLKAPPGVKPSH